MLARSTWKSLGIGIVGGLLLIYVIRPIIDRLPSAVLAIAGAISQKHTDAIYLEAAQPTISSDALIPLVLPLFFILMAAWFIDPMLSGMSKVWRAGFVISLFFLAAATFYLSSLSSTSRALAQCFHSRLAVLTPYLSDRDSKELTASWILMRTQTDFEAINKRLGQQAQAHNVPSVLKSLEGRNQGRCF